MANGSVVWSCSSWEFWKMLQFAKRERLSIGCFGHCAPCCLLWQLHALNYACSRGSPWETGDNYTCDEDVVGGMEIVIYDRPFSGVKGDTFGNRVCSWVCMQPCVSYWHANKEHSVFIHANKEHGFSSKAVIAFDWTLSLFSDTPPITSSMMYDVGRFLNYPRHISTLCEGSSSKNSPRCFLFSTHVRTWVV